MARPAWESAPVVDDTATPSVVETPVVPERQSPTLLRGLKQGVAKGMAGMADMYVSAPHNLYNLSSMALGIAPAILQSNFPGHGFDKFIPPTITPPSPVSKLAQQFGAIRPEDEPVTGFDKAVDLTGQVLGSGGINPFGAARGGVAAVNALRSAKTAGDAGKILASTFGSAARPLVTAGLAGGAGAMADELSGGNPMWTSLAMMLSPSATGMVRSGVKALIPTPERQVVGQNILESSTMPGMQAQQLLGDLGNAESIIPGSLPTTAQAHRDNGLAKLELAVAQKDPRFLQRTTDQRAAQHKFLTDTMPANNGAANLQQQLSAKVSARDAQDAMMQDRQQNIAQQVAGELPSMDAILAGGVRAPGTVDPTVAGQTMRAALSENKMAAKGQTSAAFKAIDPERTTALPLSAVRAEMRQTLDTLFGEGAAPPNADLAAMVADINKLPAVVPFETVQKLRSRARKLYADASNPLMPRSRDAAVAASVLDSLDSTVGTVADNAIASKMKPATQNATQSNQSFSTEWGGKVASPPVFGTMTPEQAAQYKLARDLRKQQATTFEERVAGDALKTTGGGGSYAMPDPQVPAAFWKAGPVGQDSVTQFVKAAGSRQEAISALTDYAMADLRKAAVDAKTGKIDESSWRKWMVDHNGALSQFPELKKKLTRGADAQALANVVEFQRKAAADKIAGGGVGAVVNDSNPQAAFNALFDNTASAKLSRDVAKLMDNDPKMLANFQGAFRDFLAGKTGGTLDANSNPVLYPKKIREFLRSPDNQALLSTVFPDAKHRAAMYKLADEMERATAAADLGTGHGASTAAYTGNEAIKNVEAVNTGIQAMGIVPGLKGTSDKLGDWTNKSQWLSKSVLKSLSVESRRKLLADAMLDPALAKTLIQEHLKAKDLPKLRGWMETESRRMAAMPALLNNQQQQQEEGR